MSLTILALFVVAIIAAPWTIGDAVSTFRSGRRGRGVLNVILALFWVVLAVYLALRLSESLNFLEVVRNLSFVWNIVMETLQRN